MPSEPASPVLAASALLVPRGKGLLAPLQTGCIRPMRGATDQAACRAQVGQGWGHLARGRTVLGARWEEEVGASEPHSGDRHYSQQLEPLRGAHAAQLGGPGPAAHAAADREASRHRLPGTPPHPGLREHVDPTAASTRRRTCLRSPQQEGQENQSPRPTPKFSLQTNRPHPLFMVSVKI